MMSLSNSIHLPLNDASIFMNPVIFPPGRGKLATNPLPTGSETTTNTIGIVLVSRCSAATTWVVCPRITSGFRPTSSLKKGLHVIEIGPSPSVVDPDIMTIYPAKLLECFRGRRSTHHCPRITVGKPEKHTNTAQLGDGLTSRYDYVY